MTQPFSAVRHPSRPPDVDALLALLERRGLEFVLVGSVAAIAHGIELEPGDLDIVPSTDASSLRTLIEILRELEAQPLGPFGEWIVEPSGEQRWIARPTTDEELRAWTPEVDDIDSFDHRFVTRLGDLDIVPRLTGTFAELRPRAERLAIQGRATLVAPIGELLARLTVPRRAKDIARVAALRAIQRRGG